LRLCTACGSAFDASLWRCAACGHRPPEIDGYPALAPALAKEGGHFHAEYFEQLAALEDGNFWFRGRNELIVAALKRYFPDLGSFLEIGCGTGFVLSGVAKAFPEARLTGSEIFCAGLLHAGRRLPGAELLQMDARAIPYSGHFDVIGAFDVLEHITEDEQVLGEMHKALKPGGGLLLTVPHHRWLWSHQDEMACHVRRYSTGELRNKVVAAGFSRLFDTAFVSLLLPLMYLSRLRRRTTAAEDPLAELRLGKMTNSVFSSVMSLERGLLRRGIRFPLGGSLLLVARKK
jgi:SAM-dependent methyltransferase